MTALITYSIKNSFARRLTFILTVAGIGLVVFVFSAVLMLSNGLREALVATGSDGNAIVLRASANTEIVSILFQDAADIVKADPAIARDSSGAPEFTNELMVLFSLTRRGSDEQANVPIRGATPMSLEIRPQVKLTAGRLWRAGTSEIVAGIKAAQNFEGCGLGETVRFAQRDWTVVGLIEAGGAGFESELWGDVQQMRDAFQRPIYSSFTCHLQNPADFPAFKSRLESDRRLTVEVFREKEYYRRQSRTFATFIDILGTVISIIFSLGAIVGAMITMYAAVANRTREIGTLRALGFGRLTVLTAFLVESLVIALSGGIVGVLFANLLGLKEVSTTNFDTFSEIAFSFRMSPEIAVKALLFAVIMGLVGGFLPAVRAARLRIINALRAK
jgi:ABC-type antimicrobial peptide transport system permease subunit